MKVIEANVFEHVRAVGGNADGGNLQSRVYRELKDMILDGPWRPGHRVPSTRTIARSAGISRTTAIAAVEQLIAEGWLLARPKSGTFVARSRKHPPACSIFEPASVIEEGELHRAWRRSLKAFWSSPDPRQFGLPPAAGVPELRYAISRHVLPLRHIDLPAGNVSVWPSVAQAVDACRMASLIEHCSTIGTGSRELLDRWGIQTLDEASLDGRPTAYVCQASRSRISGPSAEKLLETCPTSIVIEIDDHDATVVGKPKTVFLSPRYYRVGAFMSERFPLTGIAYVAEVGGAVVSRARPFGDSAAQLILSSFLTDGRFLRACGYSRIGAATVRSGLGN